jgi:hypothetical protein
MSTIFHHHSNRFKLLSKVLLKETFLVISKQLAKEIAIITAKIAGKETGKVAGKKFRLSDSPSAPDWELIDC